MIPSAPFRPSSPIRSLADVEAYERERPLEDRIPATVYDLFLQAAERWPDRPALTFLRTVEDAPQRLSYRALAHRITQAANLFVTIGGPGGGVAYLLPSLPETHICLWAAETAGFAVPLNPLLNLEQLQDLVGAADVRLLVTCGPEHSPEIWAKALALRAGRPDLVVLCVDPPADNATTGQVIDFVRASGVCASDELIRRLDLDPHRKVAAFHTGGTTGTPKLVAHTHRNQLTAALGAAVMLDLGPSDIMTNGMPLFHVGGAMSSLAALMAGAETVMLSTAGFRDPSMVTNLWRIVERFEVTIIAAVPTALSAILSVPVDGRLDSVRFGVTGAAATPRATAERFAAVTGRPLYEVLGMTETGGVTAVDPTSAPAVQGSVGFRLPYTSVEIRAVSAGSSLGEICPPDTAGVLMVRGPNVSTGYLDPAQNPGVFDDGWVNTGDLAVQDPDGRLWITGRSKDLIIRSGHNIDPAMIEDAMTRHPAVQLAAAVGEPDTYAGELPLCFVTLKPGMTADPEELLVFARDVVPERPAWPRVVHILPEMPLTAVGKIYKPALRAMAVHNVLRANLSPRLGSALKGLTVQPGSGGQEVRVHVEDAAARTVAVEVLSGFVLTAEITLEP